MKILLILADLYKGVGGGQTVYKKIVEATPDVDFYYFAEEEPADAVRPRNAHPIRAVAARELRLLSPPPHIGYKIEALRTADQVARAVAGQSFDIVDVPDFVTFGSMLPSAFAHHQVTVGRLVLAMHGNISDTINLNWRSSGDCALEQKILEREQFEMADAVYAVSLRYMREWQAIVSRQIYYIDPAHFVLAHSPVPVPAGTAPSLYCIGRSERRKGNDLFVELVRWLDPSSYATAAHVGAREPKHDGKDSADLLHDIAKLRGIGIDYYDAYDRAGLATLFASPAIVILPVRYDTLNLVALEALFSGCPVAVSSKAGVCDYLDEAHPGLPYLKLDLGDFYGAAGALRSFVANYHAVRESLVARLQEDPPKPATPLDMAALYRRILADPPRQAVSGVSAITAYKAKPAHDWPAKLVLPIRLDFLADRMSDFLRGPGAALIKKMRGPGVIDDDKFRGALADARWVAPRLRDIGYHREARQDMLRDKLQQIHSLAHNPLYRCNFWLEIARLQRLLGNELLAVTYELRVLRLLGEDRQQLLPRIMASLHKLGFVQEAEAVKAMYGDPAHAEEQVYAFLKKAYDRNLDRQDRPFESVDDRRSGTPKVSVIVSLYKAADKLAFFLTALSQQTLLKQGLVEIVLIDSGSPTDERAVVVDYLQKSPLNLVYARSQGRETIQAAWNRGIGLARAPYLVFLGVDETLYPEALETLAGELDREPDVDWVMANSLVTAVTESGLYKHDIMPYDRSGGSKQHVYLETCYLSWVGGMYRKSLHERYGYYDESFSAAGDTEFKGRILPHIKVKFVDQMLGLFLNYPDGQTTASSKAEIEDVRAWYVHRTSGGVRYAFENAAVDEAEWLLRCAVGYRKSYCGHMSCDTEYARYLAGYIRRRQPKSIVAAGTEAGLDAMLQQQRALEIAWRPPTRLEATRALTTAWKTASHWQTQHRAVLKNLAHPCYTVLNDNRYEQHSWLWNG